MPKIDLTKAVVRTGTIYPEQFKTAVKGREKRVLGDLAGLTQFGVNLTTLKPGAASALRHWHEVEDEFVFVVDGELVLVEDDGETVLKAGEAAGFKAGVPNGHQLVNKSNRDAVYLEVGTRGATERAHYPDVDLGMTRSSDGKYTLTKKSGEPYR
jgi:uncharacterized cupin superfamily protein